MRDQKPGGRKPGRWCYPPTWKRYGEWRHRRRPAIVRACSEKSSPLSLPCRSSAANNEYRSFGSPPMHLMNDRNVAETVNWAAMCKRPDTLLCRRSKAADSMKVSTLRASRPSNGVRSKRRPAIKFLVSPSRCQVPYTASNRERSSPAAGRRRRRRARRR